MIERVKHKTTIMTSAGFFKTDILEGLEGWLKDERSNSFCNKERGMDVLAKIYIIAEGGGGGGI